MNSKLGSAKGKADGKGSHKGGASSSGSGGRPETQGGAAKNPLNDMKKKELLHYKTEGPGGKVVCQF